jgi:hypothetical protein
VRLFLGKNQHKKRAGKVSQRVDPEFKPQFHKKKKKEERKKDFLIFQKYQDYRLTSEIFHPVGR